jgi:ankyrin repeat protein
LWRADTAQLDVPLHLLLLPLPLQDGYTPLHNAARYGHKEVAELLLGRGADVKATTRVRPTPLLVV